MKLTSAHLDSAIQFAARKHGGQTRRGDGRPYVLHPISVLISLTRIKKSRNFLLISIACIMHDLVEDTDVTLQWIAENYGYGVAHLVEELTSDKDEIKKIGKTAYLADKMMHMSSYALCIKLADRLDNVEDINPDVDIEKVAETEYILNELRGRKLTSTHRRLIGMIEEKLNKNGTKTRAIAGS